MSVNSYRDLKVWQLSMEIGYAVREMTLVFPKQEMFGLASQIQRAVVSIPANIAEGHERDSTKEYLRHLSIAQGSRAELETELMFARKSNYISQESLDRVLGQIDEVGRMITAIQKTLKRRLDEEDRK